VRFPQSRIVLLSKAPEAGKVKTRLIPLLGAAAATQLYTTLLYNTLDLCTRARLCPVDLWCSPTASHPFFRQCHDRYPLDLHTQPPGDLGQRMSVAIATALQRAGAVIVIGADCPGLAISDLETALEALRTGTDVVIGPAHDGGYYLIGLRAHHASLFTDMAWGTASVLADTLARTRAEGLRLQQLTARSDLDTPADYAVYRQQELIQ